MMNIYVKSRGYQQKQDYIWTPKEPNILAETGISKLIDGEYFSLVIARYDDKLLLYVTALESARADFRGRQIRNSVLWEGEDALEENLRRVAVLALQDQLSPKIENAITEAQNNSYSFQVNMKDIELGRLLKNQTFKAYPNPGLDKHKNYLAKYDQDRLQELADELKRKELPNREGMLIVVTTSTTEAELEQAGVWRGISELVATEEEQNWKEIGIKKKDFGTFFPKKMAVAVPVLLISLATVYHFILNLFTPSQNMNTVTTVNPPSPVSTLDQASILIASNSLSICEPVKLEGRYNPEKTPNILLMLDGKYKMGESEENNSTSKIILNRQAGTWNLTYKFTSSGERKVSLKGKDVDGKEIILDEKTINIKEDCNNTPS